MKLLAFIALATVALGQTAVVRDLSCSPVTASGSTYACSISPSISALVTGATYRFKADVPNGGAATIEFNTLGAKAIKKATPAGPTQDIVVGDIQAGQWVSLIYDGTVMQMASPVANTGSGTGGGSRPQTVDLSVRTAATTVFIAPTALNTTSMNAAVVNASQGSCCTISGFAAGGQAILNYGPTFRIKQSGYVTRLKVGWSPVQGAGTVTGFYVQFWHERTSGGGVFDLVGTTENVFSQLVASTTTASVVTPATKIFVSEGDYIGEYTTVSGGAKADNLTLSSVTGVNALFTDGPPSTWIGYTFPNSATDLAIVIEVYTSTSPVGVAIGDSLIGGNGGSCIAFSDTTESGCSDLSKNMVYQVEKALGITIQNMGVGAQTTAQLAARFALDVSAKNPRFALIEGGINDVRGGTVTQGTFHANWSTMLSSAASAGVTPVVMLMFPCSVSLCSDAQMTKRDTWNADLATLAATYNAVIVDVGPYIGMTRFTGPGANLWDLLPSLSSDGLHLNDAGYARASQAIIDAINRTQVVALP